MFTKRWTVCLSNQQKFLPIPTLSGRNYCGCVLICHCVRGFALLFFDLLMKCPIYHCILHFRAIVDVQSTIKCCIL